MKMGGASLKCGKCNVEHVKQIYSHDFELEGGNWKIDLENGTCDFTPDAKPTGWLDLQVRQDHDASNDTYTQSVEQFIKPGDHQKIPLKHKGDFIACSIMTARVHRYSGLGVRSIKNIISAFSERGYSKKDIKSLYYRVPRNLRAEGSDAIVKDLLSKIK